MKEILITGGCGYLGAKLSKHFAENGYGVSVFDSIDPSKYYQWTSLMKEIIVGDIRDEVTISKLAEKEYDAVIHLISLDHHKSEENPNIVSSINVMPTWNLLDKFTKNGLKKFIYFSTVQVYGKIATKL
jgi:UDP-glucose 4-epimerase